LVPHQASLPTFFHAGTRGVHMGPDEKSGCADPWSHLRNKAEYQRFLAALEGASKEDGLVSSLLALIAVTDLVATDVRLRSDDLVAPLIRLTFALTAHAQGSKHPLLDVPRRRRSKNAADDAIKSGVVHVLNVLIDDRHVPRSEAGMRL
jgi:hypothetical protein